MFVCFVLFFCRIPSYSRGRDPRAGSTTEKGTWVPVIGRTTGSTGNEKIKGGCVDVCVCEQKKTSFLVQLLFVRDFLVSWLNLFDS